MMKNRRERTTLRDEDLGMGIQFMELFDGFRVMGLGNGF